MKQDYSYEINLMYSSLTSLTFGMPPGTAVCVDVFAKWGISTCYLTFIQSCDFTSWESPKEANVAPEKCVFSIIWINYAINILESKFSVSFRIDCRNWLPSNAAKNGNLYL